MQLGIEQGPWVPAPEAVNQTHGEGRPVPQQPLRGSFPSPSIIYSLLCKTNPLAGTDCSVTTRCWVRARPEILKQTGALPPPGKGCVRFAEPPGSGSTLPFWGHPEGHREQHTEEVLGEAGAGAGPRVLGRGWERAAGPGSSRGGGRGRRRRVGAVFVRMEITVSPIQSVASFPGDNCKTGLLVLKNS